MNYTTIAEFIDRVGTTNMNNLMNEYTDVTARQTEILNEAEGLVEGFAKKIYSTPLYASVEVTSYLVKMFVLNIAQYNAYIQMEGNDIPERIKRGYEATIEQLKWVSEGIIKLPDGTDGSSPSVLTGGSSVSLAYDDAVFTSTYMDNY